MSWESVNRKATGSWPVALDDDEVAVAESVSGARATLAAAESLLNLAFELRTGHGFPSLILLSGQDILRLFGGFLDQSIDLLLLIGRWGHRTTTAAATATAATRHFATVLLQLVGDVLDLFLLLIADFQILHHVFRAEN